MNAQRRDHHRAPGFLLQNLYINEDSPAVTVFVGEGSWAGLEEASSLTKDDWVAVLVGCDNHHRVRLRIGGPGWRFVEVEQRAATPRFFPEHFGAEEILLY